MTTRWRKANRKRRQRAAAVKAWPWVVVDPGSRDWTAAVLRHPSAIEAVKLRTGEIGEIDGQFIFVESPAL